MKIKVSIITLILTSLNCIYAHCQIPCGIFNDALRIITIQEDFETIRKAMKQITKLSTKNTPKSKNQLSRWIQTKEDHSNNIQNILCDYFLIQRVKKSKTNYTEQLTLIHQILISAMKCKQTLENKHIENGINHLNLFSKAYLDKHGIEHLQKLRN
tara:strand:- start:5290 stop:5757 length:468 start_codon:yes stop_codon:yes gene_type:complete